MVSSQDTAVAVALRELGETVTPSLEVTLVTPGSPADGALAVRDLLRAVDGTPLERRPRQGLRRRCCAAIKATPSQGNRSRSPCSATARRSTSPVAPEEAADCSGGTTGSPQIGIQLGAGVHPPVPVAVTHRPAHRRAERRADVLARDLRHPHARLADRRRHGSPAPARSTPDGTVGADRRHPAEDRRRPRRRRRAVPGPGRTTARTPRAPTTGTCDWSRCDHLRRRLDGHRGLGQGPRRRPARAAGRPHDDDLDAASTADADPALAAAVLEIESHIAEGGWDQPARLYALVDTADARTPRARARLRDGPRRRVGRGLADPGRAGAAAPERPPRGRARPSIAWPPEVDRLRGRGRAAGAAAGRRRASSPTTRRRPRSTPASTRTGRRSGSSPA